MAGISSPGIGSNLDVNGIVAKLMQAESAPLTTLAKKEAAFQSKLAAYGNLSGSLNAFQNALSALNNQSTFTSMNAMPSDSMVLSAAVTSSASAGSYNINVKQLAQSQSLSSAGQASVSATIGTGSPVKLVFEFGTISGSIKASGQKLDAAAIAGGIAANSLKINGTTITTGTSTNSASALAAQINLVSATTGVTATAQPTDTGALGAFTTISGAGTYRLDVGGINIINNAAAGTKAADIDAAISAVSANLSAAGISVSGTAAAGNLKFTNADGSNITVLESGAGASGGFTGSIGIGTSKTFSSSVSLSSANAIVIDGGNPAAAGFTAGTVSTYSGATFTQDPNTALGSLTIDNTNNSLQGIRDAINKANIGVTASIVSDGSATPYRLVLKSNTTGETSSMKISVTGTGPDVATFENLLGYDPAGTQSMTQGSAAQNAKLDVNGIQVSSRTNSVTGAIEGVSLNLSKVGNSNLNITGNTSAVQSAVSALVKAYNDVNTTIKNLTGYDSSTKQAGILIGDSTVRDIQAQLRKMLSSPTTGSNSSLRTLSQVGISIDKDGVMSVDSGKLSEAMNKNMSDVTGLFSSIGTTTDSLIKYVSSSSSTMPGEQDIFIKKLATQGKLVGSQDVRSGVTINNANKDLTVMIDGVTASVSLVPSALPYTAEQIASQVQAAINGASALSSAGISVSVKVDSNGFLNITSGTYGSVSKVSVSGSGASVLLGASPAATDGTDVDGSIGGVPASGSGQFLTGASGSPAAGIKVQVTGGAENAARGTVTFSQGYAFHLNNLVGTFLGDNGMITGRTNGINQSIKDIDKMSETLNNRLADIEKRYRAQFTALDVAIGQMSQTSAYLTQQLAIISAQSKQS